MKNLNLPFTVIYMYLVSSCMTNDQRDAKQQQTESERFEQEAYYRCIDNRLQTGGTPYASLFGSNKLCSDWGCSNIKVIAPTSSDVLVIVKRKDDIVRHVYIQASESYTFELPNGTYQPFFYYGNGWDPEKLMKQTDAGMVVGGFVSGEHFSKDDPQSLQNSILEYTLILQSSGNFREKQSSAEELF